MRKYFIIMLAVFGFVLVGQAQEETETPDLAAHQVQAWAATYTSEDGTPLLNPDTGEEVTSYVAFLEFEGGLISVWAGGDYVYTGDDEAGYEGQLLIPDPDITVSTQLSIVDDDTRSELRTSNLFGTEQLSYINYTRTDEIVEIWSESPRNFIETTMLTTCMGRPSATLSFGWVAPDLLMPIYFADDGTVEMDYRIYVGGEHEDISTRPMVDGSTTTTVIIRSLDVGTSSIGFNLHGTIDDRDDCEMIYESSFTPFDADFENIFSLAEEIGADFSRD